MLDTDTALTTDEAALLQFEREWWRYAGQKEASIQEHFGCSPTSYYRRLNDLIDDERALAQDPMLVKRLRRLRSSRANGAEHRRAR